MISVLQMAAILAGDRTTSMVRQYGVDDEELIADFVRNGDEEAFECLVHRYQDRVFRLALSILGRGMESDAEDITQEIFIILFQNLHKFRHESAFPTWLYRLARNRIIDHQRRIVRRASRVGGEVPPSLEVSKTAADPLSSAIESQRAAMLLDHIDRLPEMQRAALLLFYWQDQSIDEISELLELKPNTVKSHLFRARQNLAAGLGEDDQDV